MSGRNEDDFFIGWAEMPKADRRFFLQAGIGLTVATLGLSASIAAFQNAPGPGIWDQAAVREWTGIVTGEPYAMLRTSDLTGRPVTVLLSCLGKCGAAAEIGSLSGRPVVITGSLIQRGRHAMIAVNELGEWIRPLDGTVPPSLTFGAPVDGGKLTLAGEILDSKCWFGAMRPSRGKVHKACASLCIRGGIPPAFSAEDKKGQSSLLIMTQNGAQFDKDMLSYIADPVRLTGRVKRQNDLLFLDVRSSDIQRV